MSLDKAINHGKEHRKPYTGSKAIDRTCRNHQGCPWCEENRKHKFRDKRPGEMEEVLTEEVSVDEGSLLGVCGLGVVDDRDSRSMDVGGWT